MQRVERMKLEWKDTEHNEMNWDDAKELEKDGWRLPTRGELCDAYDNKVKGFYPEYYWSSSIYDQNTNNAWFVNFHYGYVSYNYKTTYSYCVRLCKEVK
jgi:hypothetical protein